MSSKLPPYTPPSPFIPFLRRFTDERARDLSALIEYILSGLLDAKFTNLQSALFRHVLPAILQAIPHPTIESLKLVLANGLTPEQTANLDERLRQFFTDKTNGFYSSEVNRIGGGVSRWKRAGA